MAPQEYNVARILYHICCLFDSGMPLAYIVFVFDHLLVLVTAGIVYKINLFYAFGHRNLTMTRSEARARQYG